MNFFDELKLKFPVMNFPPWGECLVVPGAEFDPDWEVKLGDEGYRCVMSDLDLRPVTVVPLHHARSNGGEREVYAPTNHGGESTQSKENKNVPHGPRWSTADDQKLLETYDKLVSQGKKYGSGPILAELFKDRSESGVKQRLKRLLNKREKQKGTPTAAKKSLKSSDKTATESTESTSISPGPEPIPPIEPTSVKSVVPEDSVLSLLREIRDLLKPQAFCFEYHCPNCNLNGTVDDSEKIWQKCPVCGSPLIVWNVEA